MNDTFLAEMDDSQDRCYDEFRAKLGLPHTEQIWDAFVLAWTTGKDWGHQIECS